MRTFAINLLTIVFTLNSTHLPVAHANQATPANVQQLVNIRNQLILAQNDLNKHGYVSKTTLIGLSAVAVGIGATVAGGSISSLRILDRVANAGQIQMGGLAIAGGSPVLASLVQQVKEFLGSNVRSDLNSSTKKLISITDSALLSRELSFEQTQNILVLRKKLSDTSESLSRNPWYMKTLNLVEGAITLLAVLGIGIFLLSGVGEGIAAVGFFLIPASAITVLLRAADEAYEIHTQKQLINKSIVYLDKLIEADQIKKIIILP